MNIGNNMKKSIFLISLVLFSCSPAEVQQNATINYTVNSETMTARVVESTKFNNQTLNIPETITYKDKVYNVASIAKEAFKNNKYIKTINMPNSITSIGYDAFRDCTSLEVVNFSNGVKVLPDHLFAGCTSLIEFNNGEDVETIYKGVFRETSLKSITFNNVKELNINTFFNCSSLENVSILGSYTSLPISFFENCSSLKNIILNENVNKIESYAFKNCVSLKSYDFTNINYLGVSSFEHTGLKNIDIKVNNLGKWCFYNCDELVSVKIDTPTIEEKAFYDCNNLTSLKLDKVSHIKTQAFYNTSIEELLLPSSLEEISSQAFENSKLKSLTFEENSSLKIISRNAFYNCLLQGTLTLPSSLSGIYHNAFSNNNLEKVNISSSTSVDYNSFDNNVEITYY